MRESEVLSNLIAQIYDAALDPGLWPQVMKNICAFVPGCGASLYAEDTANKKAALFFDHGQDPKYLQLYFEKYGKLNPISPLALSKPVGAVIAQEDLISQQQFRQTVFYKEWVEPQGLIDSAVILLEKSTSGIGVLAVRRSDHEGLIDSEARRRLSLLAPHVRRAVLIGRIIDFHKLDVAALTETLSSLAAGIFLLDHNRQVLSCNAFGQSLLDSADIVRSSSGLFSAVNSEVNLGLQEMLMCAGRGDNLGGRGVALPIISSEEEPWLVHVLPLTSGLRFQRHGMVKPAVTAVFVRKADLKLLAPVAILAKLYKLTNAETRTLHTIADLGGVPSTAEALGISEATVRTHLKNIFEKTGTNSQVELVKLVASFSSPVSS